MKTLPLIKILFCIFLIGFFLNLLWERAHHALYICPMPADSSMWWCSMNAAFKDSFIIMGIFLIGALLFHNWRWAFTWKKKEILFMLLASFIVAWVIEARALSTSRWGYTSLMPIIPFFEVGLSPMMQMILLVPLTFFLTQRIHTFSKETFS